MTDSRPPHAKLRSCLLAIALTLTGLELVWLFAIRIVARTMAFGPGWLKWMLPSIGVLGFVIAIPLARLRDWRGLAGMMGFLILGAASGIRIGLFHAETNNVSSFAAIGAANVSLLTSAALFAVWFSRPQHGGNSPYVAFSFVFLGMIVGVISIVVTSIFEATTAFQIDLTAMTLALVGFVYLGLACLSLKDDADDAATSPAPSWPRRLRWFLLGSLPVASGLGAVGFITTDLSPMPLFSWMVSGFGLMAWLVALARSTPRATAGGLTTQVAAGVTCMAIAVIAVMGILEGGHGGDVCWGVVVMAMLVGATFAPKSWTLVAHAILLVLAVGAIYGYRAAFGPSGQFGTIVQIMIHLLLVIVSFRGSFGDAVDDAPPPERLPEFLTCVVGGAIVFSAGFLSLPALVLPESWGIAEYPFVLVACFVVRLWARFSGEHQTGT